MKINPALFGLSLFLAGCGLKEAQVADQQVVRQLMAEKSPEIEACYTQALKKNPHLPGGKITVRAEQHIDGRLHSAQLIRGFAGSNEVFDCVATKVNSWKTEAPKTWGPVDLSFEFKNRPQMQAKIETDFGTAMKEHRQAMGECFEKEAQRNPAVTSGEIKFKFTRTKDGRVRDIEKVHGFKGSEKVLGCMTEIMENFKLGETPTDAQMTWSHRFNKTQGTAVRDSKGNWH